ncbi:XisI protein [Planktothricoides raciborskii]|uniref:XisI protein n=2 Tax=Planktothricoides raciborskii TaxID=132608 RepID=A0AAU8JEH8_9CYAN|nr:XisI protein [Planktothricoides raciborskii]MBD2544006.1 XisI protein [Planktothricoides raciborskii FACHB-1370]MBD2582490.1 XisI protein [Planktothricoides raciborskii FACHB-1261]
MDKIVDKIGDKIGDKIEYYRLIIQSVLADYASIPIANGSIDCYTVFDTKQDHYQVMNVGWDGYRRVYGCVLHLDIQGGKIWVQQNMTEMRIAQKLVDLGVPKQDIVLGFQPPEIRQYTEYSVV